jgi:hypothetical protein
MGVICAEVAIVCCYFQLCREDYRWSWRAFCNTATAGLYFFVCARRESNTPQTSVYVCCSEPPAVSCDHEVDSLRLAAGTPSRTRRRCGCAA